MSREWVRSGVVIVIMLVVLLAFVGSKEQQSVVAVPIVIALNEAASLEVPSSDLLPHQGNDCAEWVRVSFRQKQIRYRAEPERWGRCICEGDACDLDRLYLTGRITR